MFLLFVYHVECVFLIVPCHVEIFNLGNIKSSDRAGSRWFHRQSMHLPVVVAGSMVEKRPGLNEGSSLRKRSKRVTPEQLTDVAGSTTRVPIEKEELMELEEAPERGYTIREPCEVEDWVGADKYFTSIMMRLKTVEGKDPLIPRWSVIALAKQVYECFSEELMNRADKSIGLHFFSALIDRVHDAGRLVRS
ncbi:hypothetical protein BHM03_00033446 [Ensete ventricosum]|nr:hypothetical protein BHM03_00033446 [Ensete ventricosum]